MLAGEDHHGLGEHLQADRTDQLLLQAVHGLSAAGVLQTHAHAETLLFAVICGPVYGGEGEERRSVLLLHTRVCF